MTRIPLIEPDEASEAVREVYARLGSERMDLLNVMKVFAHDRAFLAGFGPMIEVLYFDPVTAPRHCELAWQCTSQVNTCHY